MPDIWLINGIPGSGKSTTARALAARLPKSAHIEGDKVHDLIISGSVPPGGKPAEEENAQIHLCVRNQCLLARSFAQNGFTPMIDYVVVNQERVREYLGYLQGLSLHLVTLTPSPEVALARDSSREKKGVAAPWTFLDAIIRKELSGTGLWIDNATMGLDAVVDHILANQSKASLIK